MDNQKRMDAMASTHQSTLSKVPEVTLLFLVMKIAATTLGETSVDAVNISMNLGYLVGTLIFTLFFLISVFIQNKVQRFHPLLYWVTIIATSTVGTNLPDFADRSLGIGDAGGSLLLFSCLMISLLVWYRHMGSVSIATVSSIVGVYFGLYFSV
jgi:uncharacterized membrane-anchored protein